MPNLCLVIWIKNKHFEIIEFYLLTIYFFNLVMVLCIFAEILVCMVFDNDLSSEKKNTVFFYNVLFLKTLISMTRCIRLILN